MATVTADNKSSAELPKEVMDAAAAAGVDVSSLAKNVSLSGIYGACTGCFVKKFTKDLAYGVGAGFIFLQALSHHGLIEIHWGQVNKKVQEALDQDGDGKFDAKDAKIIGNKFLNMMKNGMPDAAGFAAGLYAGIKYL